MRQWITEIKAKDPNTGKFCRYYGPTIVAPSKLQAEAIVKSSYPYCIVIGQVISSFIDEIGNTHINFSKITELSKSELN